MASSIFLGNSIGNQTVNGQTSFVNNISGTNTSPGSLVAGATTGVGVAIYADLPIEAHSSFANAANFYTHSDTAFRAPTFVLSRSNGTQSSPTVVSNGSDLGYYSIKPYNGTSYVESNVMRSRATEAWDGTHQGSNWQFSITPNTTIATAVALGLYTNTTTGNTVAVGISTNSAPADVLGLPGSGGIHWSAAGFFKNVSDGVWSFTNQAISAYGSLQIASDVFIGFLSGARSTRSTLQSATGAVTLSGASTATGNIIPAGATVESVSTTTTTAITGATGYQVGDGSDADRFGDITGTALGTNSGSANYTADPRWWATSARAVTLTAKTSNFTGGVVQVTVFYWTAVGA